MTDDSSLWDFDHGNIRLEIQGPLTRLLWEKLKKYVELLEPDDTTTEETELNGCAAAGDSGGSLG